ncbi:hypothetical protein ABMA27_010461 [Loxostege sticticalis]|uniref:Peptidase A2 domain-containing protein n=1 Tax=Loxostege sticticalis TaxID=481309 RepID=A0ABR3H5R3_LOXSC
MLLLLGAKAGLRNMFAPKKLPYVIYQEIVQTSQDRQSTETFIAEKRALIAQLPETHRLVEDQLIDLVYGQLRLDIRERVARDHVTTFDELLEKAREVERHMKEKSNLYQRPPAPTSRGKRCNFCRIPGHSAEACRKKAQTEQNEAPKVVPTTATRTADKPKFSCYGCGEPGVIVSRCTKCSTARPTTSEDASFYGVNIAGMDLRPVVRIKVGHIKGTAQIDTGARSNIASYSLYKQLQRNGYLFEEKELSINLADGIPKKQKALIVRAPITLFGRVIPSTLTILPQATNNITQLGVGFITDALLMLNIPQRTCRFLDDPSVVYELEAEPIQDIIAEKLKEEFTLPQMISPMAIQPMEAEIPSQNMPEVHEAANIAHASTPPRQYDPLIPLDLSTPPNKKPKLMFDGHSPVIDALYYDAQNSLKSHKKKQICPLCESEQQQLEDLLHRNEDAFIANAPYRLSAARTHILRQEVNKMLESDPNVPDQSLGLNHSSALRPFRGPESAPLPSPAAPLRKRGRPKKVASPTATASDAPLLKRHRPKKVEPQATSVKPRTCGQTKKMTSPTPVLASSSGRLWSQRGSL